MKEYHLVVSYSAEKFSRLVTDYLKNGWELYGYPVISRTASDLTLFAQSVVKREGTIIKD